MVPHSSYGFVKKRQVPPNLSLIIVINILMYLNRLQVLTEISKNLFQIRFKLMLLLTLFVTIQKNLQFLSILQQVAFKKSFEIYTYSSQALQWYLQLSAVIESSLDMKWNTALTPFNNFRNNINRQTPELSAISKICNNNHCVRHNIIFCCALFQFPAFICQFPVMITSDCSV